MKDDTRRVAPSAATPKLRLDLECVRELRVRTEVRTGATQPPTITKTCGAGSKVTQ
jgi:hypothetical protein